MAIKRWNSTTFIFLHSILFFIILCLTFCTDEGEETTPVSDGYYPLVQNSKRIYLNRFLNYDNSPGEFVDTIIYTIKKDTIIEGLTYSSIYNQYEELKQLVRKDKTKYYGRNVDLYNGFNEEYLFLDESLKQGSTWTHSKNEGYQKTVYVIKSKSKERMINSITYKDIIEVAIDHFVLEDGEYNKTSSSIKIYAKNIGEVYSYYSFESVYPYKYELNLLEYSNQ